MIPAERQKVILSLLTQQEVISITELLEHLDVSHMTIRRDITKLESLGKVISVSGGVQLSKEIHSELSHDTKAEQQAGEKAIIGSLAADLIPPNAKVYLDAGTTCLEIAHQVADRDDLLIVTNDFVIAAYLISHSECEIYHTGGKVDRGNQSTLGRKVAEFLLGMNIDIAFISTSSWNLKGLSTPSEGKVEVKQAIVKAAKTTYLVSDSTKYGQVGTFHALDIESIDGVVSDNHLAESVVTELEEKNILVINK